MARRVFYSFHYKPDNWRASQVRNIGVVEGNAPVSDNDWETVTSGGDQSIRNWIAKQMNGRTCTVVLIGAATAGRKWINYEIKKSREDGMGLLGIYVHRLKDNDEKQSTKGQNPFEYVSDGNIPLSRLVKTYDPLGADSRAVYKYIADNVGAWVEVAVATAKNSKRG